MQINKEHEFERKPMYATQEDFIKHFNSKGEKMISAADIYTAAKQENKGIIESLKQDFKDSYVITSTRIIYNKDNLNADIIHDANSTIAKPKTLNQVKIPVLDGEVGHDVDIEAYLQSLFDTKDSINEIMRVLKRFDNERKLYLWTPSQSSRANKQVRCVSLCFSDLGRFDVFGDGWFIYVGLSRGVIVESKKQNHKTKGMHNENLTT